MGNAMITQAAELKHAGNDAFKASHLPDAVRLYTQATKIHLLDPIDKSPCATRHIES